MSVSQLNADGKNDKESSSLISALSADRIKDITQCAHLENVESLEMCIDSSKLQLSNLGELVPNLKYLKLSNGILPQISDLGLSFNKLEILWMSRCCLRSLNSLDDFKTIREIYLSFNDISDISPLGSLTKLEILDLEGNKITEKQQIKTLSSCIQLVNLTLEGNPVIKQFKSYSNYWTYVKDILTDLKYLDNISTESTHIQRNLQNECYFDDEWNYINRVIEEFSSSPYQTGKINGDIKTISNTRSHENIMKQMSFLTNKPTSSIHLTPEEKRQQVRIDNDGTVHNIAATICGSKAVQKWAESLPKIKPIKSDLTCGSIICGDIGKALRQRRTTFAQSEIDREKLNNNESSSDIKLLDEVTEFDGEVEDAVIEGLQNDSKDILDELEKWRNEFLRKPRIITTKFKSIKDDNPDALMRNRPKPAVPSNSRETETAFLKYKAQDFSSPRGESKYQDPDAKTTCSGLKKSKAKLRPILRISESQSRKPRSKLTFPKGDDAPTARSPASNTLKQAARQKQRYRPLVTSRSTATPTKSETEPQQASPSSAALIINH